MTCLTHQKTIVLPKFPMVITQRLEISHTKQRSKEPVSRELNLNGVFGTSIFSRK